MSKVRVADEAIHFIRAGGAVSIRLTSMLSADVVRAARDLEAPYIVAAFDRDYARDTPVWSVIDIRQAATRVPGGMLSLPIPIKTFSTESPDPAVMYALALLGGGRG